jgi:hypothetical protein
VKKEVRLYIEGGGVKASRVRLRKAFRQFLRELDERARDRGIRLSPEPFGDRQRTFGAFRLALQDRAEAFNVLLVDSEGPVNAASPWTHLKVDSSDNWDNPGAEDKHCHLMVQAMEAWLIADRERLREHYGRGFQEKALSKSPNVEEIPKENLKQSLRNASRKTKKGPYHETKHAPEILATIRPSEVQRKARHCKRLFDTLADEIDTT